MNDKHCSVDPPCPCLDDWLDLTSPLATERIAEALEAVDVRYAGVFSNAHILGPRALALAIIDALTATSPWAARTAAKAVQHDG